MQVTSVAAVVAPATATTTLAAITTLRYCPCCCLFCDCCSCSSPAAAGSSFTVCTERMLLWKNPWFIYWHLWRSLAQSLACSRHQCGGCVADGGGGGAVGDDDDDRAKQRWVAAINAMRMDWRILSAKALKIILHSIRFCGACWLHKPLDARFESEAARNLHKDVARAVNDPHSAILRICSRHRNVSIYHVVGFICFFRSLFTTSVTVVHHDLVLLTLMTHVLWRQRRSRICLTGHLRHSSSSMTQSKEAWTGGHGTNQSTTSKTCVMTAFACSFAYQPATNLGLCGICDCLTASIDLFWFVEEHVVLNTHIFFDTCFMVVVTRKKMYVFYGKLLLVQTGEFCWLFQAYIGPFTLSRHHRSDTCLLLSLGTSTSKLTRWTSKTCAQIQKPKWRLCQNGVRPPVKFASFE